MKRLNNMITIRPANTEEYNDIRSFYHIMRDIKKLIGFQMPKIMR